MQTVTAPSARSVTRTIKCVEAMKTAADCIGAIEPNMALFAVTRGQFSMIDAILHCLREMGPSRLTVWTWCIADYEIETMESLLRNGDITAALLVLDQAGEKQVAKSREARAGKASRQFGLLSRWVDKFGEGSIKVCLNHAKIATLGNGKYKVLIRGSMNLNHNPRFEQLDITEGAGPFDLVQQIENELPTLGANYTRRELEDATGAHCLFTDEELKPFQTEKLKIWAK